MIPYSTNLSPENRHAPESSSACSTSTNNLINIFKLFYICIKEIYKIALRNGYSEWQGTLFESWLMMLLLRLGAASTYNLNTYWMLRSSPKFLSKFARWNVSKTSIMKNQYYYILVVCDILLPKYKLYIWNRSLMQSMIFSIKKYES